MNYIKITIKNLRQRMSFSWRNMIGLSVAMTAFLLVIMYVSFKSSYDQYHAQVNQVCPINTDSHERARHTCCLDKPCKKLNERVKKLAVCSRS